MNRKIGVITAAALSCVAGLAGAQPTITSLGTGIPLGVTNGATFVGGSSGQAVRWTNTAGAFSYTPLGGTAGGYMSSDGAFIGGAILNNPPISGNTATGISPPFSIPATFTPFPLPTTSNIGARWSASSNTWTSSGGLPNDAYSQSFMCFGTGDSGGFCDTRDISADGRFTVGQTYISTYNTAGTAINASNTFRFRGYVWDSQANGGVGASMLLPTPMNAANVRRRDGRALAVSQDGSVIVGAQDPNSSTSTDAPDPDGGRPIVYRWNAGTSQYDWSYLPDAVRASGNPFTRNVDSFYINAAGTIIVGTSFQDITGAGPFLARWVWNAGTSTWDRTLIGSTLTSNPAWLPPEVISCGLPAVLTPTGMSDDGSTIVGFATWSTCGSFMRAGFHCAVADGLIQDWYEYCIAQGVPNIATDYSPVDIDGLPVTVGLPRLGNPLAISPDGGSVAGAQGGNQIIPSAVPWVLQWSGGPACVAPFITTNPVDSTFTRCSSLGIILNARAGGTLPLSYQWYKGGTPLFNGPTGTGSTITGATGSQLRVTLANATDAGTYYCVANGCNGQSASTTVATVQLDTSIPAPANDTCASAIDVGEGVATFSMCNAWADEGATYCPAGTALDNGDVWYRYTPTFTGEARFQTCASTFNTSLVLMDGCGGSVLACTDDVGSRGLVGTSCSANRSVISRFPVTTGVPILVRVGALGTPTSTGSLNISVAPPAAPNDDCTTAIDIGIGATAFNLAEATDDTFTGCTVPSGNSTSNRDIWYRLVTDCGGTYTIATCGSTISNPMLNVYDACGGVEIACNDNVGSGVTGCTSNQARILDLVIDGPVYIRVSASGANVPNSGLGTLTVSGTPANCCDPDVNCDGSINGFDIEATEQAVNGDFSNFCQPSADLNGDGAENGFDIETEEQRVNGAPC
ncbi:hypothetical protein PHYC_00347 [Phycisphaerales bacterium]|nr:hypothetical protein PHYC_00347 [Phycisphaerales bacterium]